MNMLAIEVRRGGKGHALSYVAQCGMHRWPSWAQGLFAPFPVKNGQIVPDRGTARCCPSNDRPLQRGQEPAGYEGTLFFAVVFR